MATTEIKANSNVNNQLQTVNLVVINDMITVLTVLQFKLLYCDESRCDPPGASIPLRPWCIFPPVSDVPLFQKNFRTFWQICTILPFSEKFLDFHPPKFLMTFFVFSHPPQISNSPLFSLFQYISPCFAKIILSPYFYKFSPCFRQIHLHAFYILYVYFSHLLWPWCIYASPNAHTGCPC